MGMSESECKDILEKLYEKVDNFIEQYDKDMRGDMDSSNGGKKGIVDNLRELRQIQKEYPSMLWLFAHKPFTTMGAVLGVFALLSALMAVGLLNFVGAYFGINIP